MKHYLRPAAAIMLILMLLCGCNHLSLAENLPGAWRSDDGYTAVFAANTLQLYDENGVRLFDEPLSYTVNGNYLHLTIYMHNGMSVQTEVFECRVDGRKLTLIYDDSFLAAQLGENAKSVSISLERID